MQRSNWIVQLLVFSVLAMIIGSCDELAPTNPLDPANTEPPHGIPVFTEVNGQKWVGNPARFKVAFDVNDLANRDAQVIAEFSYRNSSESPYVASGFRTEHNDTLEITVHHNKNFGIFDITLKWSDIYGNEIVDQPVAGVLIDAIPPKYFFIADTGLSYYELDRAGSAYIFVVDAYQTENAFIVGGVGINENEIKLELSVGDRIKSINFTPADDPSALIQKYRDHLNQQYAGSWEVFTKPVSDITAELSSFGSDSLNVNASVQVKDIFLNENISIANHIIIRGAEDQTLACAPLNFLRTEVASSNSKPLWVKNNADEDGGADLIINGVEIIGINNAFTVVDLPANGITIAAACSAGIDITFTPITDGVFNDTLLITSNDPLVYYRVGISGTGGTSEIRINPITLEFDAVNPADSDSSVKSFTIENHGCDPLVVSAIDVAGAGFELDLLGNLPLTLSEGEISQPIEVVFKPEEIGMYSGSITIISDHIHTPNLNLPNLIGYAISGALIVAPDILDFGEVPVPESAARSLYLKNTSTRDVTINEFIFNPEIRENITPQVEVPFILVPDEDINVEFVFQTKKDDLDEITDTLTISTSSSDIERPIRLKAMASHLEIDRPAYNFENVPVTLSKQDTLWLKNKGNIDLSVDEVTVTVPFEIVDFPQDDISPNDSASFIVSFSPTESQQERSNLYIVCNDPHSPIDLNNYFSGKGIPHLIDVNPQTVDFGGVEVPAELILPFTLQNLGGLNIQINNISFLPNTLDEWYSIENETSFTLARNASESIDIKFHTIPADIGTKTGSIVIDVDGGDAIHMPMVRAIAQRAVFTPITESCEFGQVWVGCSDIETIRLYNAGNIPLEISNVRVLRAGEDVVNDTFSVSENSFIIGLSLYHDLEVTYSPSLEGSHSASLEFTTNDAANPTYIMANCLFGTAEPAVYIDNPIRDITEEEGFDTIMVADLHDVFKSHAADIDLSFSVSPGCTVTIAGDTLIAEIIDDSLWIRAAENTNGSFAFEVTAEDSVGEGERDMHSRSSRSVRSKSLKINMSHNSISNSVLRDIRARFSKGIAERVSIPRRDYSVINEFTLHITPENDPPYWVEDDTTEIEVAEGERVAFTLIAKDPDYLYGNDALSISLEQWGGTQDKGARFNVIDDTSCSFIWHTSYGDHRGEPYRPIFQVTDQVGEHSEITISITVTDGNRAPMIRNPGNHRVNEDSDLIFNVEFFDPDEDEITLVPSSDDLPDGYEFTDNGDGTGGFSWRPGFEAAGSYTLIITASDGHNEGVASIGILVNNTNRPPRLEAPVQRIANEGDSLTNFILDAEDDDNDDLSYSIVNPMNGQRLDGNRLIWRPAYNQQGVHDVIFVVRDNGLPNNLEDRDTTTITVNNINRIPVIEEIGVQGVDERDTLRMQIHAYDPDGDTLIFEASSEDEVLSELLDSLFTDNGDGTGDLVWTPGYNDEGTYTVTFTVSDLGELVVGEEVTINVVSDNFSPQWDDISDQSTDEQERLSFNVTASDPDDEDELILVAASDDLPEESGWEFTDNGNRTGVFEWTPGSNNQGGYTVTFTVSDGEFDVDSEVRITVGNINFPPEWDDFSDQSTDEQEELSFRITASDPDDEDELTLEASSDDLPDGWGFTDNEDKTGDFEWTPGYNDHGEYTITFTVYDGEFRVDSEVTITVRDVNFPPELDDISDQSTDEQERLFFSVTASDPDNEDELTLEASSDDLPDGWEFTDNEDGSGDFLWIPGHNDNGTYTVIFTVSDDEYNVDTEVTITVNDVNFPPEWDDISDQSTDEQEELSFSVTASDPDDGDRITLEASSNDLPEGWEFTDNGYGEGDFVWIPGKDDNGTYTVIFTVSDDEFNVDTEVTITVHDVNFPPVWDDISDQSTDEQERLSFSVSASDSDGDELILEASSNDLPDGWGFTDNEDGSGVFVWTPGYNDHGTYTVTFTVSDGEFNVESEVTITVRDVNFPSGWDDIPERESTSEQEELSFSVVAFDPDNEDELTLEASSDDLPDGWEFTDSEDGSGNFVWTPGYNDEGSYTATFTVYDGEFDVDAEVRITVYGVNFRPLPLDISNQETDEDRELSFRVTASDPDNEDELTLEASSDDLPDGWGFTDNGDRTGVFEWTPGSNDHGEYTITFTVYDGEFRVDAEVTITVRNVNFPPEWEDISDQSTDEQEELSFRITASDPDDEDELTLEASSDDLPDGWAFTDNENKTGDFEWTPGYNDHGTYTVIFTVSDDEYNVDTEVTITVSDANFPPEWDDISDQSTDEQEELSFSVTASDPDQGDRITLGASSNDLPEGWEFTDNGYGEGDFVWIPGKDDNDTYTVIFSVSDDEFDVNTEVTITVRDVYFPPEWDDISDQSTDEQERLSFSVTASDPDGDELTLDASSNDLPDGWGFTDNEDGSGDFLWIPGHNDHGTYTVIFIVNDGEFDVDAEVTITVRDVNFPPEWDDISDQSTGEQERLSFRITASDPDDEDELTLEASSDDLPDGWGFTDNGDRTGVFEWTPGSNDQGEYTITFTVYDGEFREDGEATITVGGENFPPEWDDIPESRATDEQEELSFRITASDPDGEDELTLEASSNDLPDGWEFTDNGDRTGVFEWTPGNNDHGEYTITFTVYDGEFRVDAEVTITVRNVNFPPEWEDISDKSTDEQERLSFTVIASDPDDEDELTLVASFANLPDGWEFTDNEDGSGDFVWIPGHNDHGTYTVIFSVNDSEFDVDAEVRITVDNVNFPPE
ncbi:MAG: Ig-like domain-containing protein [Candidatus Hatepunaea meridiana]|nr:Ig-like domain-containing protein [Candidatus Hatepunaea meridiana]